ncbi:hypothetical protein GPECTOR_14g250 [Gonium pectorale]|uniref:Uncharacterized protein n=1 Tax=Gonium pectorale TaxID=33097 RepID=A0A150GMD3_GONPE|nr:hypothetical protein GPECTOR_14g250 [Gonium pectorale]|eukprot:KXZ51009.1 hypothetical protein GPECTOR_14g250 [Gonium pectorale]
MASQCVKPFSSQASPARSAQKLTRVSNGRARSVVVASVQPPHQHVGRRSLILSTAGAATAALLGSLLGPSPASADVVKDLLRGYTRPDVGTQDAVVILMDARSTLKEIQGIAATPSDSEERFRARAFWPAYAKRLRAVAEAAPVVAGVVVGAGDKEETLSEYYGGKAAEGAGVADAVYQALGRVLTISGRTIRAEAQASPQAAADAEAAISSFLQKVPTPLLESAQEFRVARAAAATRA